MDSYTDSSDRRPVDYFFFALAFLGFLIFAWGIILGSPTATFAGALVLLLPVLIFYVRDEAIT